ncbi:MAG: class I SAM-dependent methyltransferase [Actinocatenispora sp.]
MDVLTVDRLAELYLKYHEQLREVKVEQRALLRSRPGMRAQLDDVEAEITYLLLRDHRPDRVVEIGSLHGWSTSWILRALRDNGHGGLHTFDRIDNARRTVPADLAGDRWRFVEGDVRARLDLMPDDIGYLFLDAAHGGGFARWYLDAIVPRLAAGTPVSVHDVFHERWARPFTEGAVVLRWLARAGVGHFTASRARAPEAYRRLVGIRQELGLGDPVHTGRHNPMLYFRSPRAGRG